LDAIIVPPEAKYPVRFPKIPPASLQIVHVL